MLAHALTHDTDPVHQLYITPDHIHPLMMPVVIYCCCYLCLQTLPESGRPWNGTPTQALVVYH